MKNNESFYTLPEVAEKLKVSRQSVYRWVRSGTLSAYKFGQEWRIKESDLNEFIDRHRA